MRVLVDNCVSRKFSKLITGHEVVHARQLGWADLQNGDLLNAAERNGFDVLITTDKSLQHQQSLAGRKISVITLAPRMTFFEHLVPLLNPLNAALSQLPQGAFIVIEPEKR